jgi:hypothetical protein
MITDQEHNDHYFKNFKKKFTENKVKITLACGVTADDKVLLATVDMSDKKDTVMMLRAMADVIEKKLT